jgi:hypothetical protein
MPKVGVITDLLSKLFRIGVARIMQASTKKVSMDFILPPLKA